MKKTTPGLDGFNDYFDYKGTKITKTDGRSGWKCYVKDGAVTTTTTAPATDQASPEYSFVGNGWCADGNNQAFTTYYRLDGSSPSDCKAQCSALIACMGYTVQKSGSCTGELETPTPAPVCVVRPPIAPRTQTEHASVAPHSSVAASSI